MVDTQVTDDKPDFDDIDSTQTDTTNEVASELAPKKRIGRPPKDPGLLPPPIRTELTPVQFFNYWRSLTAHQLNNATVYVYRMNPVVDVKHKRLTLSKAKGEHPTEDESATTNIGKLTTPFGQGIKDKLTDADVLREVLQLFGCGDYTFGLNDAQQKGYKKQVCRTFVSTPHDYANHPPILDINTLVMDDYKNEPYIKYLRSRGEKLPGDEEVKEEEKEDMANADTVRVLSDALIEQTRKVPPVAITPTVVAAPQESADKLLAKVLEANAHGTEVLFNILEKVHTARAGSDNPLTIFTQVGDAFAKISANMGSNGESAKLAELEKQIANLQLTQITALRDEVARLREERAAPPVTTAPKTMIEQLDEAMNLVERFKVMSGGGKDEPDDTVKKTTNGILGTLMGTEMPWWGPILGNVAGMAVQALIQRGMSMPQPPGMPMGGMAGMPNPMPTQPGAPVMNPPVPIPGQVQQPIPPQQPNPIQDDPMMQAIGMLQTLAPFMINHLDLEKSGYEFAEFVIAGWKRPSYDMIKQVGMPTIMGAFQFHPEMAAYQKRAPERVAKFVEEFFTLDEMAAADDGPDPTPINEAPRKVRRPAPIVPGVS